MHGTARLAEPEDRALRKNGSLQCSSAFAGLIPADAVQIGFFALILVEAITGQGFLLTLGIQVPCSLLRTCYLSATLSKIHHGNKLYTVECSSSRMQCRLVQVGRGLDIGL